MNHERFLALLDTHGADLALWPMPARAAAERLLETAPEAGAAWRAAREIERMLFLPPAVPDARVSRLVEAVARQARQTPRETVLLLLFGRLPARWAGALCAGLLALGWLAGGMVVRPAAGVGELALLGDEVPSLFDGGAR